jgi:hypothetical protein
MTGGLLIQAGFFCLKEQGGTTIGKERQCKWIINPEVFHYQNAIYIFFN